MGGMTYLKRLIEIGSACSVHTLIKNIEQKAVPLQCHTTSTRRYFPQRLVQFQKQYDGAEQKMSARLLSEKLNIYLDIYTHPAGRGQGWTGTKFQVGKSYSHPGHPTHLQQILKCRQPSFFFLYGHKKQKNNLGYGHAK